MAPIDINGQEVSAITLNGNEINTVQANGQEVFSSSLTFDNILYYTIENQSTVKTDPANLSQTIDTNNNFGDYGLDSDINGNLYVGDKNGSVKKVDKTNMSLLDTGPNDSIVCILVGADGFVYAGEENSGGATLHKYDPTNMTEVDSLTSGNFGFVTGAFNQIMGWGNDGYLYVPGHSGFANKVNPNTMNIESSYSTENDCHVCHYRNQDGFVYASDRNGVVYKLDPNNNMNEVDRYDRMSGNNYGLGTSNINDSFIYFGDSAGIIYKIDPTNMSVQDTLNTSAGETNSGIIVDNKLYVNDASQDHLYRIDTASLTLDEELSTPGDVTGLSWDAPRHIVNNNIGTL